MFTVIKKIVIVLLINMVSVSNHTKYIPLSNKKCKSQLTISNLNPNEYRQKLN